MSIDTLTAAKLAREQAEAIATAIRESDAATVAQLATKADLDAHRAELELEIDGLRKQMHAEIEALRKETSSELKLLKQRMTIKLGTMPAGAVALMPALVKLP
jgi:hypothetical protein